MAKRTNEGRKGGMLDGDPHSAPSGGIKAVITDDSNRPVLLEGKEAIINKKSVNSNTKHNFDGKEMTNKEVLSAINTENGNGVPIMGGGGIVPCNCLEYLEFLNLVF